MKIRPNDKNVVVKNEYELNRFKRVEALNLQRAVVRELFISFFRGSVSNFSVGSKLNSQEKNGRTERKSKLIFQSFLKV